MTNTEYVTIDGCDSVTDTTLPLVNIWQDYDQRDLGTVATVKHGDPGRVIGA